jgi:hypothetical protein
VAIRVPRFACLQHLGPCQMSRALSFHERASCYSCNRTRFVATSCQRNAVDAGRSRVNLQGTEVDVVPCTGQGSWHATPTTMTTYSRKRFERTMELKQGNTYRTVDISVVFAFAEDQVRACSLFSSSSVNGDERSYRDLVKCTP